MPRRARVVDDDEDEPRPRARAASTPQDREDQLISLAYDLVEERIRNKSASSQETTHFLKLGSSRERLEQNRLGFETELLQAKKRHLDEMAQSEEKFNRVLRAMRQYQGLDTDDNAEENEEEYDDYEERRPRFGRRRR